MSNRVIIFDTTLRDGEQSPGAAMNLDEKVTIAHALSALGVDVIEAGFPIASPGDFEAVRAVAREVEGPIIAGLCRCLRADIDRAWEALREASRARLHVFLATSAIHRQYKLRMAREEIIKHTIEGVSQAREYCEDVEFSAEDAARTEPEFLGEVVERAIEAGATTINIPDTVGYAMPDAFASLIGYLKQHVANIDAATISVHCHNDLGLAVANSLAAVHAGARQIECTINGIGERAGNASLEEVVMALRTRNDFFGLETSVDTTKLFPTSQLVSRVTGLQVQRNKAIVGRNAFAHEAGIHQHGVLQHQETYEIMRPEDVGRSGNELVLGKHSGRHALREWAERRGFPVDQDRLKTAFEAFKVLADRKKEITEEDLTTLFEGVEEPVTGPWKLIAIQVQDAEESMATASVEMLGPDGVETCEAARGSGYMEAMFAALRRITVVDVTLKEYQIHEIRDGEGRRGRVRVAVEWSGKELHGQASGTDPVRAAGQAALQVMNRIASGSTERNGVLAGPSYST